MGRCLTPPEHTFIVMGTGDASASELHILMFGQLYYVVPLGPPLSRAGARVWTMDPLDQTHRESTYAEWELMTMQRLAA